jgi:hydrophobic/amphiphilic exporter-1 (mainly G- bacteria), HAE1 family
MIEAIVSSPVKVAVGVVLVVMFGVIAIYTMPVQLTPEVEIPTLTIETRWPGASPEEVEREIVQEQEEQLQSVEGVRKMTSESMDSQGKITLEFSVGINLADALLRVNTRLSQVREYPENADEPTISTSNASDRPIAWFVLSPMPPTAEKVDAFIAKHPQIADELRRATRASNPALTIYRLKQLAAKHPSVKELISAVDVTELRRFAEDTIEARFERVDGVSNSNVIGGREEELQLIVDPQRLAARQLTIIDVRNAMRANKDTSGGDFWEGKRRYVVRTLGERRSVQQVADAVIARRNDESVYVKDVAEVRLGFKKPDGIMRRFGSESIGVNVMRETGSNVLTLMDGLRETCQRLNENILNPRGLQLTQVYDETDYIYSSVGLVADNLYEGGILTFLALLLFLRSVRSSVVIFVSIAVSFIGMFLVMRLLNRSLNVPSLAGIAFATGMLVDNFIVVLENIYRHRNEGDSGMEAVVNGTREVWGAVLAATLANLAVFVPVLFVQDEAGQLFRDIALATSSALAISLLVALILVPTAAASILRSGHSQWKEVKQTDHSFWARFVRSILTPLDTFGRWFIAMVVGINAWLQKSVSRQLFTAFGMITASVVLSWIMLPQAEYLPNGNRNLVFGLLFPPPGYNTEKLTEMGLQIEDFLKPYWDVDPDSPEAAKLDYPVIADFFFVARGRQLFLGMRAHDPMRAAELEQLVPQVSKFMPGTLVIAKQSSLFEKGLSSGRTIDVEITGPDVRKLVGFGGKIMGMIKRPENPVVKDAQAQPIPSLDLSSPEMHVIPKWEQAADMGVGAADLGYTVDALVDGAYASDFYLGGDKIDLTILGSDKFTGRTQDLEAFSIATPGGQLVPLAAVAEVKYGSGPEQINRRERQRAITISVSPPATMPLEQAIERIQTMIIDPLEQSGELGDDYQINLSGTADKLKTTWQSLRWNLLLAIIITYLLIAALFESWVYPFIIMLSVPLGAVGGFFGLWLLNCFVLSPLDVLTMLGFIILVGTVVNNPILIVEQALSLIREEGMPPKQAILESVRTRIRPIFMTAFIGLFGLIPLVISPGAGSELYRGLGSVLLGGLVASTVFTLIFVPTVFDLAMRMTAVVERWRHPRRHVPMDRDGDQIESQETTLIYES